MNNVIAIVNDAVKGLTNIFMGLLGLGVLAGILFGDLMGVDVVGGLLNIVNTLGEAGFVGLLVAILLIHLFTKE
jgi:C4-dicarboxylate transporter|tara:strand:- start:356 stop:577 length:222 start_codon:yes stop_codon:yes gene_type:complete